MPSDILLIGIEASGVEFGETLSPEAHQALRRAAVSIEEQAQSLLNREIRE
jgi:hypothetical protein